MEVSTPHVVSPPLPVAGQPDPLRGRPLRRAALAILIRAGCPLEVGDVLAAIEARGRRVASSYPRKAVADALAYEHDRGWAVRVRRGTYAVGSISKTSRWRILRQLG